MTKPVVSPALQVQTLIDPIALPHPSLPPCQFARMAALGAGLLVGIRQGLAFRAVSSAKPPK
jgi:hypothetical protein